MLLINQFMEEVGKKVHEFVHRKITIQITCV